MRMLLNNPIMLNLDYVTVDIWNSSTCNSDWFTRKQKNLEGAVISMGCHLAVGECEVSHWLNESQVVAIDHFKTSFRVSIKKQLKPPRLDGWWWPWVPRTRLQSISLQQLDTPSQLFPRSGPKKYTEWNYPKLPRIVTGLKVNSF